MEWGPVGGLHHTYFFGFDQDMDHARILKRMMSLSWIIHTIIVFDVRYKARIHPAVASNNNDGEINCLYKAINNTKYIWLYLDYLTLKTEAPAVNW